MSGSRPESGRRSGTEGVPAARRDVDSRREQVARLLQEVSETHHRVYRIADGADRDWASWYADWLIGLSELPKIVGDRPVRSELVYELVRLDREYTDQKPSEPWEQFYAHQIVTRWSPA